MRRAVRRPPISRGELDKILCIRLSLALMGVALAAAAAEEAPGVGVPLTVVPRLARSRQGRGAGLGEPCAAAATAAASSSSAILKASLIESARRLPATAGVVVFAVFVFVEVVVFVVGAPGEGRGRRVWPGRPLEVRPRKSDCCELVLERRESNPKPYAPLPLLFTEAALKPAVSETLEVSETAVGEVVDGRWLVLMLMFSLASRKEWKLFFLVGRRLEAGAGVVLRESMVMICSSVVNDVVEAVMPGLDPKV